MRLTSYVALLLAAVLAAGVPVCCIAGSGHCCAAVAAEEPADAPACPHCPKERSEPERAPAPTKPCDCGDESVSLAPAEKPAHAGAPVLAPAPAPAAVPAHALLAAGEAPRPVSAAPPAGAARNLPLLL